MKRFWKSGCGCSCCCWNAAEYKGFWSRYSSLSCYAISLTSFCRADSRCLGRRHGDVRLLLSYLYYICQINNNTRVCLDKQVNLCISAKFKVNKTCGLSRNSPIAQNSGCPSCSLFLARDRSAAKESPASSVVVYRTKDDFIFTRKRW